MGKIARFERQHHRPINEADFDALFAKPEHMSDVAWEVIVAERASYAALGEHWSASGSVGATALKGQNEDMVVPPASSGDVSLVPIRAAIQSTFKT